MLDAFRTGRPVLQPDLHHTSVARWSGFGSAVLGTSIHAIFAFPLQIRAIRIGVLDLYRNSSGPLTEDELSTALAFADAATLLLLHLQERPDVNSRHPVIDRIDNHAVVHQASGPLGSVAPAARPILGYIGDGALTRFTERVQQRQP